MTSPGVSAEKYGTEQGYSENYGPTETTTFTMQPAADDPYANNGSSTYQEQQPPQQQPSANPFTQKASTNPFAR